jgi:hypothetical protein
MFLYCFWTWWYIHWRFHYLQDFIIIKEVKYIKIQDKIIDIFTNPLKYDVVVKIRDILKIIRKSSLKKDIENKSNFNFFKKTKELVN